LQTLRALGVTAATLHLNHRDVLFGLLQLQGVDERGRQIACIRAVDKLDKIGRDGVVAEIVREAGLDAEAATAVVAAFDGGGGLEAIEAQLAGRQDQFPQLAAALQRLGDVVALVTAAGLGGQVVIDRSIARGLDYYTGIIYETRLTDPRVATIGAVMSGGRYDGLIGLFGREQIPAIGISIGLDRLLSALQELGLLAAGLCQVPVYIAAMDPSVARDALALATEVRAAGLRAELDLAGGRIGKQLERAAKRGATLVLVIGSDEVASASVVIKDLRDGSQGPVARADLLSALRDKLA
jgi:histidyl-tRNA synthetase